MRHRTILLAALSVPAALALTPAHAYERPYDPYRWCAVYSGKGGGASNCGFLTWQQCMDTVSGIGGFCEPNQFYNPRGAAGRPRKRQPR
ncbi:MAG: DUF3551 domain-containing protein [Sphingobacteriales bacterium]